MSTAHPASHQADAATPAAVLRWVTFFALLCAVVGALGGWFWRLVVKLPTYVVQEGGRAVITEDDVLAVFSVDAWFVVVGVVLGAGLGWVAWRWFCPLGWPLTLIAASGALLAAATAMASASLLAPPPFQDRLFRASAGDHVEIDFVLHAPVAVSVWAAAAMVPILLLSALAGEPHDPAGASAGDVRDDGAGEPTQVGGGQLDLQAPTAP